MNGDVSLHLQAFRIQQWDPTLHLYVFDAHKVTEWPFFVFPPEWNTEQPTNGRFPAIFGIAQAFPP